MLRSRRILSWLWPQLAQWIWTFSGHLSIFLKFSRHVWKLPPLEIFASWPFEFLAFSSVLIISMHYNSKGSFFEKMMAHMLCSLRTRSCHQSSAHWSSHQRPMHQKWTTSCSKQWEDIKTNTTIGDWWNVHYLGRLGLIDLLSSLASCCASLQSARSIVSWSSSRRKGKNTTCLACESESATDWIEGGKL